MNDCVTLRDSSDTYGRIARRFGKFVQFAFDGACTERHRLRNLSYIARATTRSRTMPSTAAAPLRHGLVRTRRLVEPAAESGDISDSETIVARGAA
jgi:hypothetical protein